MTTYRAPRNPRIPHNSNLSGLPSTKPDGSFDWTWPPRGLSLDATKATEAICLEAIKRSGTDTVSIAFSCGKDSVCAMIALKHFFKTVIPVYWYLVPGLGFIEQSLAYYEQVFDIKVVRLPHPNRYFALSGFAFQPPNRIGVLDYIIGGVLESDEALNGDHLYTMDQLFAHVRTLYGLDRLGTGANEGGGVGAMHATGIRAADSPVRASLYRKFGGFAPNGLLFYPCITWRLDDIEAALDSTGLMLPPEYNWYGRSFDGFMRRYTEPIAEHCPQDMAKILMDFPLADLEFFRAQVVSGLANIKPLYKIQGRAYDTTKDDGITPIE